MIIKELNEACKTFIYISLFFYSVAFLNIFGALISNIMSLEPLFIHASSSPCVESTIVTLAE